MMSPAIFLLGIFSILTVWVITSLGLPPDLWTFGVVPSLSIYFLCDHGKLWETVQVARLPVGILGGAIAALFSILYARFMLWRLFLLLACLFCLVKAFDVEKKMYMGDFYGEVVKSMVWKVATIFISETKRMKYKGEWTYCSPYSRKPIHKNIDHYYTLQRKERVQDDIIPESYELDFNIEDCRVVCRYTNVDEDHSDTSGDYPGHDQEPAIPTGPGHEENVPSSTPGLSPLEKMNIETSPASEALGESSSSMAGVVDVLEVQDRYTVKPCHVSKLEVSLQYGTEKLESYTFLGMRPEAVAEMKRVLEILRDQDQGNLIFASLNRNVGSGIPQAHAKCYEFEELFELVLNRGFTLHKVNLPLRHSCCISGASIMKLQVVSIGVTGCISFYQLTHAPSFAIAIILVSLLVVNQVLSFLVNYLGQERHKLKRCVHYIISTFVPSKVESCYKYFQVHYPILAFCNESYGYPYPSRQRQICYLGNTMRLPITGTSESFLQLENLVMGNRVFDLKNLELHLNCSDLPREIGNRPRVRIVAKISRTYDMNVFYNQVFHTDTTRAANLIALMKWLTENSCAGVCKEWPRTELMHAYRYEEILMKVLEQGENLWIIDLPSLMDISVEGV